jgi:hypothetical protein
MTITTTSASLIPAAPVFTNTERLALAGAERERPDRPWLAGPLPAVRRRA